MAKLTKRERTALQLAASIESMAEMAEEDDAMARLRLIREDAKHIQRALFAGRQALSEEEGK